MSEPKLKIRIEANKFDNASDSLTTYSLMAVLSGTFFITVLGLPVTDLFISGFDKAVVLLFSCTSLLLILNAAEMVIDIFHFTKFNIKPKEIEKKYKRQIQYYNRGVVFLITGFIYSFWSYLIKTTFSFLTIDASANWYFPTGWQYAILVTFAGVTWIFVTRKWRRDLKFLRRMVVEIEAQ